MIFLLFFSSNQDTTNLLFSLNILLLFGLIAAITFQQKKMIEQKDLEKKLSLASPPRPIIKNPEVPYIMQINNFNEQVAEHKEDIDFEALVKVGDQKEDDTEVYYDHVNNQKILLRKDYSLTARRHLASLEIQNYYNKIRNLLDSHLYMNRIESWRYDKFKLRQKNYIKIAVTSEAIKIFFSFNPTLVLESNFNLENVEKTKIHKDTPFLMYITGPRIFDYVVNVIKINLKNEEPNKSYQQQNHILDIKTKGELIKSGLIKVSETRINL